MSGPLFRAGKTYRHINSKDVDLLVIDVVFSNSEYIKLKVKYIQRDYLYVWDQPGTIKLLREDLRKWEEINQ